MPGRTFVLEGGLLSGQLITTKSLVGLRAVTQAKGRKIGKVRHVVLHPSQKRVIGLMIKRPDAALMFHRKDLFVALGGFDRENGQLVVHEDPKATDKGAAKALSVDLDECVIWVGMPVMTMSGDFLGYVDTVTFDAETGAVHAVTTENGAADTVILGKRSIPAQLIKGFRRGQGIALAPVDAPIAEEDDEAQTGAILVSDEALQAAAEGGVAAAAGKATAQVTHAAKKRVVKVKRSVDDQVERVKPTAQKVAARTSEAAQAGTFAVGKQLGKASGMFSAFKEEFEKASKGDQS